MKSYPITLKSIIHYNICIERAQLHIFHLQNHSASCQTGKFRIGKVRRITCPIDIFKPGKIAQGFL